MRWPLFSRRGRFALTLLVVSLVLTWSISLTIPCTVQASPFWKKLLRITGISQTPSKQKGPGDELEAGEVWVANLVPIITRQRLTWGGGYRSPVFVPGDEHILVLRGSEIMQIPAFGGEPRKLYMLKGVYKLIGSSKDDQDKILLLRKEGIGRLSVGLLSLQSGEVTPIPYDNTSENDQLMVDHLMGWERVYDDVTIDIRRETKRIRAARLARWTDVYIRRAGKDMVNLSRCDGVLCGQPSLSHDRHRVIFIKAAIQD